MTFVYSKDNCVYCVNAKMLLESKKLPFVEVKIGVDITRDEFMEKFPNARTVPQIIFEGEHIGGYDQLKARLA